MNIETLISSCEGAKLCGLPVDVKGISSDSRKVERGYLFAALKGTNIDGRSFIVDAIANGAAAILLEEGSEEAGDIASSVSRVFVPQGRKALGLISARYYGNPSDKLNLVGITGTNGKTTTSYILEAIVRAEGRSPGVIGTVNYRYAGRNIPAPNTTPEPSELQRILADMLDSGTTDCIMEVSSHAIDQERIAGCSFDAGIFTNLTMDHLDYHGTMEEYGRVKERFFTNRSTNGPESGADRDTSKAIRAVINVDDAFGGKMAKKLTNVLTYSLAYSQTGGDIFPLQMNETVDGMKGTLQSPIGRISIDSSLIGSYNLSNIMAATGAALSLGISLKSIEKGIRAFKNVPGRTERISLPKAYSDCRVFVDYAHTPDALERVIKAIRPTTKGRIVTLFGCGGDRDKDKRPLMGNIAILNSDFTIITSDNPRSENPSSIIAEIEKGAINGGGHYGEDYTIVVDRRKAINDAAAMLKSDDTLLVAGKGHEDYQIVKGSRLHFDDAEEAKKAFAALSNVSSTEDRAKGASFLFEVKDILDATDAVLQGGPMENVFEGISIDSRKIKPGELFWAIKGERFDGADFIKEALENGASGVVSENGIAHISLPGDIANIKVGSSLEALQQLAAYNRKRHAVPLVAITGSNGKTTTKEILASILKKRFDVLKNEGNLNNLIGVPLTLLKLHRDHEVAVVEMGMNSRGEIRQLTKMARPDIGVITNIGEAHLEGLGSLENVKKAKGELVEAMQAEGTVVLNADDDAVMELALQAKSDVLTFGFSSKADVRAADAEVDWGKGTLFSLSAGDETLPVLLPLYGRHQLYNALAAAAVAYSMGFNLAEIREALEEFEACSGRMEIISQGDITIINDSYNANPSSVRSAIEAMICSLDARKIAVIGDMLEMGENEENIHFELGRFIAEKEMDILFTLGPLARSVAAGAAEAGMDEANIFSFDDSKELSNALIAEAGESDLILIKGSRGMRMEEITKALKEELERLGEEN